MWEYEIRKVTFDELAHLRYAGRNEKTVALRKDTLKTIWFGVLVNNEIVACAAIISATRNFEKVRFKAGYTLPEWRGQGFGNAVVDHMIEYVENEIPQCKRMDVYTISIPFYAAKGWVITENAPERHNAMHKYIHQGNR